MHLRMECIGAPSGLNEDKELAYQMLMKDSGINMAELKALQRGKRRIKGLFLFADINQDIFH